MVLFARKYCTRLTRLAESYKLPLIRGLRMKAKLFLASLVLVAFGSLASAQSTISGVVRDTSGAVMTGVKVEAASEALIERSRTVTTASDGRYTIVDVRPGVYTMTFTLQGF